MDNQPVSQQGGGGGSLLSLLMQAIFGNHGQTQSSAQPQATPGPSQTPEVSPTATPSSYDPNNFHNMVNGMQSPTPTPVASPTPSPVAMGHPAMKLQLARAGMPQPQNPEEEGPMRKPMLRRG